MLILKPLHVSHQEAPLFSIDIHPDGTRFATGGADQKVRIWNMAPILSAEAELDLSVPLSLATLSDHFGTVNCVRWSSDGHRLASASDDRLVMIHERKEGPPVAVFGSTEQPDIERWQLGLSCRGHTSDVIDLAWSPDNHLLVSGGLDCSVRVWDSHSGVQVANLEGHTSLVKGVSWDPIGSFIASQSDDRSVIIWKTSDWSQVSKVMGVYEKTVGATFFRRLSWSPCGSFLTTTHAFASPQHTAAVIDRSNWTKSHDFVGHGAPVVAVRYNGTLFRRSSSADGGKHLPYSCLAMGGQDCRFTVWLSNKAKPLIVGKHFFKQPVVDFAWAPDGYTLMCCSTDGTVTAALFTPAELGMAMNSNEMEALKQERYGDMRGRKLVVPQTAALKALKEAGDKNLRVPDILRKPASGGLKAPLRGEVVSLPEVRPSKVTGGKRRIVPEPLAPEPPAGNRGTPEAHSEPPGQRQKIKSDSTSVPARSSIQGIPGEGVRIQGVFLGEAPKVKVPRVQGQEKSGGALSFRVQGQLEGPFGEEEGLLLEALPLDASTSGTLAGTACQLVCSRGGTVLWRDASLASQPVAIAGNSNFWVVSCEDGSLQVFTPSGRRALPSIFLDSVAVLLYCDDRNNDWDLLSVSRGGYLYLWDLRMGKRKLLEPLGALLGEGPGRVQGQNQGKSLEISSISLSSQGCPLVVLSNCTAFLFHLGMGAWLRVAHNGFPASQFAKSAFLSAQHVGDAELAEIQAAVSRGRARGDHFAKSAALAFSGQGREIEAQHTRAHLEDFIASSAALQSSSEYNYWMAVYVRHLANEEDEVRLREICEELLGPPIGKNESTNPEDLGWKPVKLGLERRKFLRGQVLPLLAGKPNLQSLVQEFLDLLNHVEEK